MRGSQSIRRTLDAPKIVTVSAKQERQTGVRGHVGAIRPRTLAGSGDGKRDRGVAVPALVVRQGVHVEQSIDRRSPFWPLEYIRGHVFDLAPDNFALTDH